MADQQLGDGVFDMLASLILVLDRDGRFITELRRNEELNRRIIETVPGGIVLVAADGSIQRANSEAEQFLGLPFDPERQAYFSDFRGKTVWEDGSECPVEEYPVSRCLATGQPQGPATIGVVRPDGATFWGVFTASPVDDPETGRPSGAVVTFLDISDRVRTQEALRASEERFRQLAQAIDGVFWMIDAKSMRPLYVSPAYQRVWGRSCQSLYDKPDSFLDGIHPEDRPRIALAARPIPRKDLDLEYRVIRPDGSLVWVRDRAFPICNERGEIYRLAGIAEDITDRKRAETALREINEGLEQVVAQRTALLRDREQHYRELAEHNRRLVQEIDHRVRNNLAALSALVSLMRDRNVDSRAFADAIESRIRGMAHIHQLLAKSGWQPVGLQPLIVSTLEAMGSMACRTADADVEGPDVRISPRRILPLAMILVEWFTNSCKYGAHSVPAGRLRIGWELGDSQTGHWVLLRWQERGGPPVQQPVASSLGTELVHAFSTRELGGRCQMRFPVEGAEHNLEFPAE